MGYDMVIAEPEEQVLTARRQLEEVRPTDDGWSDLFAVAYGHTSYFRFNVWGMSEAIDTMDALDMVVTGYPMPDVEVLGDRAMCWVPPDQPGIALHKLTSNDPWHITPLECEAAVLAWERAEAETQREVRQEWGERWDEWIAFLRRGIECGGIIQG